MSKIIVIFLVLATATLSGCQSSGQFMARGVSPALRSFEFLGCSGDWDGKLAKPEVWRIAATNQVTFLTHQVATCGLSGEHPVVSSKNGILNLSYELQSSSDAVVMCDCEYWAKFTFGPEMFSVKSVTVGNQQAELKGDWPGL